MDETIESIPEASNASGAINDCRQLALFYTKEYRKLYSRFISQGAVAQGYMLKPLLRSTIF